MLLLVRYVFFFKVSVLLTDRTGKDKADYYAYIYPNEMASHIKVTVIFEVNGQYGYEINQK